MSSTAAPGRYPKTSSTRFSRLSWTFFGIFVLWVGGLKALAVHVLPIPAVSITEQLLLVGFFVSHALGYYSGREVAFYFIVSAAVSNTFENLSVMYGFPFGYYHHTALAGPKLFNVPYLVTLIYAGLGYVCWMVAQVIVRRTTYRSWKSLVYVAPLIASFVFTCWDLCIDPIYGTIYRAFIYEKPGVWFGTPGGNYFGWMLMTYLFYLAFSLYLTRHRAAAEEERTEPGTSYWLQPILIYLVIAAGAILANVAGARADITLANGKVWNSGDIYGASTLVTIFTMGFIALLALVSLYQARPGFDL